MIQLTAERGGQSQKVLNGKQISFDSDVAGLGGQILGQCQVRGVIHGQRDATALGGHHFAKIAAESNTHGTDHKVRTLTAATDRANSNGIVESRYFDDSTVARKGGGFEPQRPATEKHAAGEILLCGHAFGDVGMKGAVPREQIR